MFRAIRLPAHPSQNFAFWFNLEKAFFIFRPIPFEIPAGPEMSANCLRVALFEKAMRYERLLFEVSFDVLKQSEDG